MGSKIISDGACSHEITRCLLLGRKPMTKLDIIKKQRYYFANKGPYSQSYGFSSSHVQIWHLDHKEGWALKNWCFQTEVLEKTLESPLDFKEIKPVHPKGNQSWIFIGRTDAEAEAPILWPPEAKSWLICKVTDTRKDWRQEEKRMTEDEMVGWHHQLDGHEFELTPGDSEGEWSLECCSPWGHKESDMTEWLNTNNNMGVGGGLHFLPQWETLVPWPKALSTSSSPYGSWLCSEKVNRKTREGRARQKPSSFCNLISEVTSFHLYSSKEVIWSSLHSEEIMYVNTKMQGSLWPTLNAVTDVLNTIP